MTALALDDWTNSTLAGRYRVIERLDGEAGDAYCGVDLRLGTVVVVRLVDASGNGRVRRVRLDAADGMGGAAAQSIHAGGGGQDGGAPAQSVDASCAGELRRLAEVRHPHLLPVLDFGEQEGTLFVVVPHATGGTLAARRPVDGLGEARPLTPAELSSWLPHAAAAIDALHRRGCVHGAVQPEAIVFDADGNAFVDPVAAVLPDRLSFRRVQNVPWSARDGAAEGPGDRATERLSAPAIPPALDLIVASPASSAMASRHAHALTLPHGCRYLAPEVLVGHTAGPRSDQYSLAVVVYEALCGRLPYRGATLTALAVAQAAGPPPELHDLVPGVSELLSRAVAKGLASRPEERFPTSAAFAAAVLEGAGSGRPRERSRGGLDQRCPLCGTAFALDLLLAGKSVLCGSCWTALQVSPDLARLTVIVHGNGRGNGRDGETAGWSAGASEPTSGSGNRLPRDAALVAKARGSRRAGSEINSIGQRLVGVAAGEFPMGSPASHTDADGDERPWHRVELTRGFLIGAFPVTQAQYEQVMGVNPSAFSAEGRQRERVAGLDTAAFPVECVSWLEAIEFCNRLSRLEGFEPYYAFESPHWRLAETRVAVAGGPGYRLPTEAEWECACRVGTSTVWHFGDDEPKLAEHAWYGLAHGRTQAVGGKRPNPLGLYDLYGNVWEWCHDWYAADAYAAPDRRDPQGPASGSRRVLRGGAFFYTASCARSGYRFRYPPTFRLLSVGFRVARSASGTAA